MKTFENTAELLNAWPGLDADVREALVGACATRGQWTGFMLAKAPAAKRWAHRAAWHALIATVAPVRFSVGAVLFMAPDERALFDRCSAALDGQLGAFLQAQEPLFRWSLFGLHYDRDSLQRTAFDLCRTSALEAAGQIRLFA